MVLDMQIKKKKKLLLYLQFTEQSPLLSSRKPHYVIMLLKGCHTGMLK